jgi:hypothetical protein
MTSLSESLFRVPLELFTRMTGTKGVLRSPMNACDTQLEDLNNGSGRGHG